MLSKDCAMNFSLKRPRTNGLLWAQIYKGHSLCLPGSSPGSLSLWGATRGSSSASSWRSLPSSLHGLPGSLGRSASIRCYTVLVEMFLLPPVCWEQILQILFILFLKFFYFFNELEILSSYFAPFSKPVLQTRSCSSSFLRHISHAGDSNETRDN